MIQTILKKSVFKKLQSAIPKPALQDSAHDDGHALRVAHNALIIADREGGDKEILVATALLHDVCNLKKNDPKEHMSAELSARNAEAILGPLFPPEKIHIVQDAIRCHSFSLGLIPETHEGKVFQDADRLDALGAIGIARNFATGATFQCAFYSFDDPFLEDGRTPDGKAYVVDHFFTKLFKLPDMMQTKTGELLAHERVGIMKQFLAHLKQEISGQKFKERGNRGKNLCTVAGGVY